ncbi:MAG TPA: hypothetical protein VEA69_11280 [Tepidisphaeraceae bacterium]|nr:hypothetical protein [Tepidisphaeraceae bacterium]
MRTAITASNARSANGSASARARTAGAAPRGRWASMTADGSTATTDRPAGSYEPAPAPTLSTERMPASATVNRAAMRGSARRCEV